jgi:hypothetical protein
MRASARSGLLPILFRISIVVRGKHTWSDDPCVIATAGTDRRPALPRQPNQVSEENRMRQSGTLEAAATAGFDPNRPRLLNPRCNAAIALVLACDI